MAFVVLVAHRVKIKSSEKIDCWILPENKNEQEETIQTTTL